MFCAKSTPTPAQNWMLLDNAQLVNVFPANTISLHDVAVALALDVHGLRKVKGWRISVVDDDVWKVRMHRLGMAVY